MEVSEPNRSLIQTTCGDQGLIFLRLQAEDCGVPQATEHTNTSQ